MLESVSSPSYDFPADLRAAHTFVGCTANSETHNRLAKSLVDRWAAHTPPQEQVTDFMVGVSAGPFQALAKANLEEYLNNTT